MTQLVPLDKRSKKAQREYHAKQRGSWHGVNPITRTVQSRKTYDRARVKQADRRDPGRQYRRTQCVKHSDHLLFLIQHSRYAPNMGYIKGDYERLRTLLHSGLHIQYMKSSNCQRYLKRRSNRKVRKYFGLSKKGNQYRKVFEYWWTLY